MFAATETLARDSESLNAYFGGSQELLHAIADALDVRAVFPRLSDIAGRMLPHDALTMVSEDEELNVRLEATSSDDFRGLTFVSGDAPITAELVIGDLTVESPAFAESPEMRRRIRAGGYRSLLRVAIQSRECRVGVTFWSKQAHTYDSRHLPLARRIADHLAVCVSHQRLARTTGDSAADLHERSRAERGDRRPLTLVSDSGDRSQRKFVGDSAQWREVLNQATRVAKTDTTVLVTGESGTGKEVVARFIHQTSGRSRGPFVALNCAALPEQLLESELFGYERGAFTSAQQAKPGQIELATGGVLFLDEVSEMSLSAQAKFLRVLQEREFQRLGGTRTIKANIRVIAATNRDLRKAVERGTFREDLFYRLQVFDIAIAPLRERRDDILPIAEALLQDIGRSFGLSPASLTRHAREALLHYDWPGNIRELRNALERAAIRCDGALIDTAHLGLEPAAGPRGHGASDLRSIERDTIMQVLQDCDGNKAQAAKRLGLTRTQLYGRINKYRIDLAPAPIAA
jgi:transcriptional regulator with GAF, ATPase, and Fis domain